MKCAEEIIGALGLQPLEPEGGYFRETTRSPSEINCAQIRAGYDDKRSLFTVIYYLLTANECSKPHRLRSDEIWFFHLGASLELTLTSPDGEAQKIILGNDVENGQALHVHIPAGWTQSAKLLCNDEDAFALVSTMVVPGFDYEDFELMV